MISIEQKFIDETGHLDGFECIEGGSNFIISAPHSTPQTRNGLIKTGEYRTGLIALLMNSIFNHHIFYKTKNLNDDANYYENCIYKKNICNYIVKNPSIEMLIDLHISSDKRKHDIEIGTGYGKNINQKKYLVNTFFQEFSNYYKNIFIDQLFTATHPFTVSAFTNRTTGIPAIQIEINWNIINTYDKTFIFIKRLENVISKINGKNNELK